jgi:hypothetical protein
MSIAICNGEVLIVTNLKSWTEPRRGEVLTILNTNYFLRFRDKYLLLATEKQIN